MLPALALLGIGAGISALKYAAIDKPRENRQRNLAATTQALSPWTHLEAAPVQEPDLLKGMLNWGITAGQLGAKVDKWDKGETDTTDKLAETAKAANEVTPTPVTGGTSPVGDFPGSGAGGPAGSYGYANPIFASSRGRTGGGWSLV